MSPNPVILLEFPKEKEFEDIVSACLKPKYFTSFSFTLFLL